MAFNKNTVVGVTTLTFDMFGTVLDLTGTLVPPVARLLAEKNAAIGGEAFWEQWRARQRIEQYQDTLLMLGHSGYLETCRRSLAYCLRQNGVEFTPDEVDVIMGAYDILKPFEDAERGLERLKGHYRLVALSNGDAPLLEHLAADQVGVEFDAIISVDRPAPSSPIRRSIAPRPGS